MEVKINKEIRNYTESMFFGLSLRQFIFSVLACGVAVGLYFLLRPRFGTETLSWVCILGAFPFAAMGFIKYKIDLLGSRVLLKGKILELTAAEYRLICLLVKNANRIITRDIILDELWDSTGDYVDNNTLSVYVRRLREKIETDPSHPEHLLTVRGFGYQWKEVDE